ncbi:MAG: hypothetical protein VX776_05885, partial [Planctomycetota bacterium]|nr:hypothetical protein [Planctomycetota bacterium]
NTMLSPPPSGNAEQEEDIADPPAENPVDPEVTTENNDPEDMGELPTQDPASEPDDPQEPDEPITPDSDSDPMDKESSPPTAPEGLTPETPDNANGEDMPPENLDSVIDNVAPFLGNAPIDIENAAPVAQIPAPNNGAPRAPAAPINIAQGLSFTVPKIDITNPIPLNQFLQFLGTLCNIPFTFDFESLELVNLSHTAGVQHTSENKTIEQILTTVLESLQLTHEIQDGHVLILAKSHLDSTISTTIYKQQQVDAAQDEPTVKGLSNIINKLLTPDDAEIAKPVADAGSEGVFHLEISGTNRTQDKTRQLLARLHTTPSDTDSYEAAVWNQYQQPFTMDFKDGAPLLQVLIYLNSISELQFQANWKNIWQAGWTPKSQVNVKTENESLQECLDQVLTSNGLAYIARANGVLEITSAEHALDTLQIGLYDLSKMPVTKRDALVKTLQQLTADTENDITIKLMETLPDGRLGLSAPAAIHRLVAERLK